MIRIPSPLPNPIPSPLPSWALAGYSIGYAMQDPDAAAYVAAVKAAGVTDAHLASLGMPLWSVSAPAIDAFVLGEKAAGRWSLVLAEYLPVWAIHAANVIDLRGATTGTVVGSVTPIAGSITGDGSTGCVRTNKTPPQLGLAQNSASLWGITVREGSGTTGGFRTIGGAQAVDNRTRIELRTGLSGTTTEGVGPNSLNAISVANAGRKWSGYYCVSRTGASARFVGQLLAGAWSASSDTEASFGVNGTHEVVFLAYNNAGTMVRHSNLPTANIGIGLGMTQAQAQAMGAARIALWETIIGLTLP